MGNYIRKILASNFLLRIQLIALGLLKQKGNQTPLSRPGVPINEALKVSVLMPTYNRAHMLQKAIDSFFRQDYKNAELIVLNNGSKDNTEEVLSKYTGKIKVISRAENNIRDAMNVLWKSASGDLICLLFDDDEFFGEQSLSARVQEFNQNEKTEVVYGGVMLQDFEGKNKVFTAGEAPNLQKLLNKEYINLTSMMWRNNIKKKFMFDEDFEFNGDTLFKIRCLKECHVSAIEAPVMAYTVHEDQETRRMHYEGKFEKEKKLIQKKLSELYNNIVS